MTKTIEKRLEGVERELASLKGEVKSLKPDPNWISSICGTFKDDPEFDEVLRLGRNSAMLMRSTYGLNISRSTSSSGPTADPTEFRDQP